MIFGLDLLDPKIWISLMTLTVLEVVLGIDNIIFISILSGKLPLSEQRRARSIGLLVALFARLGLLSSIFWLTKLTATLFEVMGHGFTGKDLVMLSGGIFLIWKSVHEIHGEIEGGHIGEEGKARVSLSSVIAQIVVVDLVFSIDSVITAVGLVKELEVMIAAVVLAMFVMLAASGVISGFVQKHPSIKMLALAFLILVGVILVADGWGQHVERGYIYFAMAFSFAVEMLNINLRARRERLKGH